jgi:tetratricopeptide (TPR) repeat protein
MRREVCEATQVRHEQPEAVMTLRVSCLDGQLERLRALTGLLAVADSDVVAHAPEAAGSLARLADCADVAALTARVKPPDDARAPRVAELRERLAHLQVEFDLGRYRAARDAMVALATEAKALAYQPLEAEVLYLLGRFHQSLGSLDDGENAYVAAYDAAEAGGDRHIKALAAIRRASILTSSKRDIASAAEWLDHAAATLGSRGDDDPQPEAGLALTRTSWLMDQGKYADALVPVRKALDIAERAGPFADRETLRAAAWMLTSFAQEHVGDRDAAIESGSKAIAVIERALGPSHPKLTGPLENLGLLELDDHPDQAVATYRRALAISSDAVGPDSPDAGVAMLYLVDALVETGRYEEAYATAQRAKALVVGATWRFEAFNMEGLALTKLGRSREAIAVLEAGVAFGDKELAGNGPALGRGWLILGGARMATSDTTGAIAAYQRAHDLYRTIGGPDLAEIDFALARAQWQAARDRPGALALARQARETYAAAKRAKPLAEVDAWLALVARGQP